MTHTLTRSFTRADLGRALAIAAVMAGIFTWLGGLPLVVTFDVGLVVVAAVLVWLRRTGTELPEATRYYPVFLATLAWQFIHFTEEFSTGFYDRFPALYGAGAYSQPFFVGINMVSYALFSLAAVAVFSRGLRFLVTPVAFFVIYGAIGNAIAHTWWVIWLGGYFPGFYTAQAYWLIGPFALARLLGSWRAALVTTAGFALLLVPALTLAMVH
jgi:hypothetical protein